MLNYELPFIPSRPGKKRESGITMMMDKGLSIREVENFCEVAAEYTDLVKFGFGTSLVSNNLETKIKIYKEAGIRPYFGGTLFEIFLVRNKMDDFRKYVDKYKLDLIEVSDGSMKLEHHEKLNQISILKDQYTVLSEVGTKQAGLDIPNDKWLKMMVDELAAGTWKVITEARESGNIGIYNKDGSANTELINQIIKQINVDNILWEAPLKNQQVWFVKLLGPNVNLGNIATNELISLETIRLGLRGDTFNDYLPK